MPKADIKAYYTQTEDSKLIDFRNNGNGGDLNEIKITSGMSSVMDQQHFQHSLFALSRHVDASTTYVLGDMALEVEEIVPLTKRVNGDIH